ncbi:MAG: hypothetical protein E7293_04150 [Lachnospiraceae bacterium]|nr:hypothetical protein [Lachnospiraceae bacterium]
MNRMEIRRKQLTLLLYIPIVVFFLYLPKRIGDNGMAYFAAALCSVFAAIIPFFAGLTTVVERLLRPRYSKGQHKNADRIWRCALIYALVAGTACMVLWYGLGEVWMSYVLKVPHGLLAFRLLVPIVLLAAVAYVLKGYFQGQGNGMPTVCFEGICLVSGIVFALFLGNHMQNYGEKVAALLANHDFKAMYGAAGTALGLMIGYVFGLAFLLVFRLATKQSRSQRSQGSMKRTESYAGGFRLVFLSFTSYILTGILVVLPMLTGLFFYQSKQEDIFQAVRGYGAFVSDYLLWIVLALLPIVAGGIIFTGQITTHLKKEEYRQCRDNVQNAVFWLCSVSSLIGILYMTMGEVLSTNILCTGGLTVLFAALAICFLQVLWNSGRTIQVYVSLAGGFVMHLAVLLIGLKPSGDNVSVLSYALIAQTAGCMMISGVALLMRYRFKINWIRCVAFPLLASAIAGLVMLILKNTLLNVLGKGICIWLCFGVGIAVHILLILVLRCCREQDLREMPGGRIVIRIGKLLRFM